jgi:hypothetical protein
MLRGINPDTPRSLVVAFTEDQELTNLKKEYLL